jgi:hypothetical protein
MLCDRQVLSHVKLHNTKSINWHLHKHNIHLTLALTNTKQYHNNSCCLASCQLTGSEQHLVWHPLPPKGGSCQTSLMQPAAGIPTASSRPSDSQQQTF